MRSKISTMQNWTRSLEYYPSSKTEMFDQFIQALSIVGKPSNFSPPPTNRHPPRPEVSLIARSLEVASTHNQTAYCNFNGKMQTLLTLNFVSQRHSNLQEYHKKWSLQITFIWPYNITRCVHWWILPRIRNVFQLVSMHKYLVFHLSRNYIHKCYYYFFSKNGVLFIWITLSLRACMLLKLVV